MIRFDRCRESLYSGVTFSNSSGGRKGPILTLARSRRRDYYSDLYRWFRRVDASTGLITTLADIGWPRREEGPLKDCLT